MSTHTGREAEAKAAAYLERRGYMVLQRNWRNRWCEIDIVAQGQECVHFVEVKYRQSATQGSGIEYITPRKIRQLRLAARHWVAENGWEGDYQIDIMSVAGNGSIEWIDNAIMAE
jgi:putative endonuclease